MSVQSQYILLTAAKNEADYIGQTIESVLSQTVRPLAWFIVDDGSTDDTAKIVKGFADRNPFIRLLSSAARSERSFGSKDKAINAAYEEASKLGFEFLAILDADITFDRKDYHEQMLGKFESNPK